MEPAIIATISKEVTHLGMFLAIGHSSVEVLPTATLHLCFTDWNVNVVLFILATKHANCEKGWLNTNMSGIPNMPQI